MCVKKKREMKKAENKKWEVKKGRIICM